MGARAGPLEQNSSGNLEAETKQSHEEMLLTACSAPFLIAQAHLLMDVATHCGLGPPM